MSRLVNRRIDDRVAVTGRLLLSDVVDERLRLELSLGARFLPVDPDAEVVVTPRHATEAPSAPDQFPLPPEDLWEWAYDYLELGEEHAGRLRAAVGRAGGAFDGPLLDFGCGTGRVMRWFLEEAREHEVWGVDLNDA